MDTCVVCGGGLESDRATCYECGNDFHLALRVDSATKDCGDAWIDEDVQALVFGCSRCLGREQPRDEKVRYGRREGMKASDVAKSHGRRGSKSKRGGTA